MKVILIALHFILLWGCKNSTKNTVHNEQQSSSTEDAVALLRQKENDAMGISQDPGKLIAVIQYELTAKKEDLDIHEDGIVPWISLENTEAELPRLKKPNELVLTCDSAILIIDYPVKAPVSFVIKKKTNKYSRKELVQEISRIYKQMYIDEEKSATVKTQPMEERKIRNRNETNGKYGIWGHDLADLVLLSVNVYKDNTGNIYLTLEINS